ncbi:hypothetical protein LTR09_003858 [Extremus antarcticus]|uniref:UBX domain-containing protein n=1 Tax=Extremus antarcticus TaxID=702011 RepID=A0AAJ0DJH3_9PEZI|nr:hypothetical protein LTR09_003858 [Extremus antarcticus]
MASDLDQLVDMGFDREKSQLALKKGGNLPSAIDWLDKNADKSLSDLQADDADEDSSALPDASASAASMVCNDCQKKFRNMTAAQAHAERTGHSDFAESSEEIAPLTEEEKKAQLEAAKQRMVERKAKQAEEDKVAAKRNDEIKRKHTKESDDAKEELRKKEQIKEAQAKRQEKIDDVAAKKRIKDKIEADKAERKRKADEEKAMRANPGAYDPQGAEGAGAGSAAAAATAGNAAAVTALQATRTEGRKFTEARLKFTMPGGSWMHNFPVETTLFEVAHALQEESGMEATSFTQSFPKKVYDKGDFGMTLKEAGLVPSAALIVG